MSSENGPGLRTIRHFSQSNGGGPDRIRHVPELLRRVADTIQELGSIEVQDITFGTEITAEGPEHHLTVYYDLLSSEE